MKPHHFTYLLIFGVGFVLAIALRFERVKINKDPVICPDGWIITDSYGAYGIRMRKLIDPNGLEYRLNDDTFKRDAGIILESRGYPAAEMGFY